MINWQHLTLTLRTRSRQPLSAHARAAGMDWRTINRLARGETAAPRWDQGCRLLDIAADHLTADDWARVAQGDQ